MAMAMSMDRTQRFSPGNNFAAREARMSTSEHEHGGKWCDLPHT
jgi:hypothetical protein